MSKVNIEWSSNFAYAIGLIASDGAVNKDQRHVWFSSKDLELITKFRTALKLTNTIGRYARGGETEKRYFCMTFGDVAFVSFLNQIGITNAKSKTIRSVEIPKEYFRDFLRGLFDGDGTFYTFQDRRWPNSFGYKISWASASHVFIMWLQNILASSYGVRGFMKIGNGVYNLTYVKGDTRKLIEAMYAHKPSLFLKRKYSKVCTALEADTKFGKLFLQKQRMPQ
ncbi:MAG: hypothetical protein A3A33_04175 [Candidatus Yanofskybacteria bacterium RIFCSPLOWO2_01_FULL_49_25]|uniref:DOD-type homing endonuclease domain-containing protein n=1 Tax=Candidatus Yanofskybacteria bacterium RIFCSPLOWO2_01_FULL_49_25 TaxID=1802701 RepID=A0A1F8GRJ9_9BACT|nr:MAG: hypothetical protein A3A33_04175 [Candidatus Yanofskybacteria bacterium RIFCSPLOWO2_01_FULL_49_25]